MNQALAQVFREHCPSFHGFTGGMGEDDPRIRDFFGGAYEKRRFPNPLTLDRDQFLRRCFSSSYALREVREMNPNTPVGCPQCGGQMDLWQAGRRLALTGLFASVTDWIEVDIYSCPACGRLAFFRTNFLPQPKKHVPVEPEPTDVDTAAFYVPGTGELVKCPVCGKEHPRDDAFCPLCGTRRDQPCPWCGKWFPAAQPVCPWCGHGRDEE